MTKMTYLEAIDLVISAFDATAYADADAVMEKLTALRDTYAKKKEKSASADRKPSRAKVANDALRADILNIIREYPDGITCKELAEKVDKSTNSIAGLVKPLVDEGLVLKGGRPVAYCPIFEDGGEG